MTQTYKDPNSYLDTAVSKRGKSGHYGAYLTSVTVVAEPETDYGYKAFGISGDVIQPELNVDPDEWLRMLVTLRSQTVQKQYIIVHDNQTYQFIPEGGYLSLNIFLPEVFTHCFQHEVLTAQNTLKIVADFVGSLPSSIRFNIGVAWKTWKDLVESGEAEEVEFSY